MRIYWYADGSFEKATGATIFAESENSNKVEFKLPMASEDSVVHATFLLPYPQNSDQFGHYIAESLLMHIEEDTEDGGYVWVGTLPGGYLANNGTAYISARVESNDLLVVKTTQQVQFEIQPGGTYQATAVLPEQAEQIEAHLALIDLDILEIKGDIRDINTEIDTKQDKVDDALETTSNTVVGAINELNSGKQAKLTQSQLDAVNSGIDSTKVGQIATNTSNIEANTEAINGTAGNPGLLERVSELETTAVTGETYIDTKTGDTLPTSEQLTGWVETIAEREPKGGDYFYFILQVSGTDKNYKYTYSSISGWSGAEIPSIEPAGNGNLGIVKGNYTGDTTKNFQVNIAGGEFESINVVDSHGTLKELRGYLNDTADALANNISKTNTNEQNISTNAGNISTLQGQVGNILNGTTSVPKAVKAQQDENGNNIASTYQTKTEGATKQYVRDYSLPRVFNDVYFVSADGYTTEIPTTPASGIQFSTTTDAVGDFTLYQIQHQNSATFELSSKNSSQNAIFVSADKTTSVYFRMTTQVYDDNEWKDLSIEISNLTAMTAGEIYKITFGSSFTALGDEVITFTDGSYIRQKLEVVTETSEEITFDVYSNEAYPSTFNINTQSQILIEAQGEIGQEPVLVGSGTLSSGVLTCALPLNTRLNDNTEVEVELTYSGGFSTLDGTTEVVLTIGNETIRIVTPYNIASGNATITNLEQTFINGQNLRFKGFVKTLLTGTIIYAEVPDLTEYVTTDTAQTITGKKTIRGELDFQQSSNTGGTTKLTIKNDNGYNAKIKMGNTENMRLMTGGTYFGATAGVITDNATDLGASNARWKDFYLAGNLSDGTNSISVSNITQGINFKNLSPTSTTLTDEELTTLQNNNCILTLDVGSLSFAKAGTILTKPFEYNGTLRGLYINNSKIGTYLVTISTKVLGDGANDIVLNKVAQFNGKAIPTYPSSTGTFNLQSVDGTIAWSADNYVTTDTSQTISGLKTFTQGIDLGDGATITKDSSNRINLNYGNGAKVKVGSAETIIANRIGADGDNSQDIGRSTVRWRDLYLGGLLRDGNSANYGLSLPNTTSYTGNKTITTAEDVAGSYVSYSAVQTLSDAEKAQARANIGAGSASATSVLINGQTQTSVSFDSDPQTQITANTNNITAINGKIPSEASSSNQLADKSFVNSSIATNTANFIGTFANVTALESYSGTITNNDYAFVINSEVKDNGNDFANTTALNAYDKTLLTNFDYAWVINGSKFDLYRFDIVLQTWDLRAQNINKSDVTLNTAYNRYKATVSGSTTTWEFEYTLNNSSFTAVQWQAINSGATATNIAQIGTNTSNISSLSTNKADKTATVSNVSYVSNTRKLQQTINGSTTDVVTFGANAFTSTAIPTITATSGSESISDGTNTLNFGANAFTNTTIPTSINGLAGGQLTSPLTLDGGASATASKIILGNSGRITNTADSTLFGRDGTNGVDLLVGQASYNLKLRGAGTRPTFNGNDLALKSDVPTTTSSVTQNSTAVLTSGGAYTALAGKANDNAVVKLSGNQFYIYGEKAFRDYTWLSGGLGTGKVDLYSSSNYDSREDGGWYADDHLITLNVPDASTGSAYDPEIAPDEITLDILRTICSQDGDEYNHHYLGIAEQTGNLSSYDILHLVGTGTRTELTDFIQDIFTTIDYDGNWVYENKLDWNDEPMAMFADIPWVVKYLRDKNELAKAQVTYNEAGSYGDDYRSYYATWKIEIGPIKIIGGATPSEEGFKTINFRMRQTPTVDVFSGAVYTCQNVGRYRNSSTANGWQYCRMNSKSSCQVVQISDGCYWMAIGK